MMPVSEPVLSMCPTRWSTQYSSSRGDHRCLHAHTNTGIHTAGASNSTPAHNHTHVSVLLPTVGCQVMVAMLCSCCSPAQTAPSKHSTYVSVDHAGTLTLTWCLCRRRCAPPPRHCPSRQVAAPHHHPQLFEYQNHHPHRWQPPAMCRAMLLLLQQHHACRA